jgi:methylthioxylose transferase
MDRGRTGVTVGCATSRELTIPSSRLAPFPLHRRRADQRPSRCHRQASEVDEGIGPLCLPCRAGAHPGYCAVVRTPPSQVDLLSTDVPWRSWIRRYRNDLLWGAVLVLLVLAAFIVPHLHVGWLSPVVHQPPKEYRILAGTAPLLASWMPHTNPATPCAVILAIAVVAWGPTAARRVPWQILVPIVWLTALAWTMTLTLIDGWKAGFVDRMTGSFNYLHDVHHVHGIHSFFQHYASHIPSPRAGSWDIETSAHPPLGLLTFVLLHRIGLSGPTWASLFVVVVGTSAAAAVLITVKTLGDEQLARRVAPFVALAPAVVWIAVSADAYYAGVAAWMLTLLGLAAATRRHTTLLALAGGVLLGCTVYLSYGLVLMAIPAAAILFSTRNYRPVVPALLGVLVVAGVITGLGFWWLTGLTLLRQRYLSTIAMDRPFAYWVWGDLAAFVCAIGLPAAVALRRAFDVGQLRARNGFNVLLVSIVAAAIVADLSAMSKAETERIWLPFAVWLVAAPALLPRRSHRYALAVQAVGALLINSLLHTTW